MNEARAHLPHHMSPLPPAPPPLLLPTVPFLYELRMLLDWTCTATSLDWYEWMKLEDVRMSLFVAGVRRRMREGRRLGQRVPRYVKVLQVRCGGRSRWREMGTGKGGERKAGREARGKRGRGGGFGKGCHVM